MKGIVKEININRGFGIIKHGNNDEIFFHFSCVSDLGGFERLEKGAWVQFTVPRICVFQAAIAP